jgi:ubiquinone/menaquinone biosynthesis C-methylase UbiE
VLNMKRKRIEYEADFRYLEDQALFAVTPRNWHNFTWEHLRKRTISFLKILTKDARIMLLVGIGPGGASKLWESDAIMRIGVDINKKWLSVSKEVCHPILASASHLPIKDNSIDVVFFELVLHHLKGQMTLEVPLKEACRAITHYGKILALEPNSLNPSGVLLNFINMFHLYALTFGGSNFEYALSPRELKSSLPAFSHLVTLAFTFLHPRFPLSVQRSILNHESFFMKKFPYFAWMFLFIIKKA